MPAAFNASTSAFNASSAAIVAVVLRVSDSRWNIGEERKKKKFTRERANAQGRNHERAAGCRSAK